MARRLFVRNIKSVGAVEDGDNPPAEIMLYKRKVSTEERDRLAGKGQALPDGSFPIANASDLRNAVQAFGRAKNQAAAKSHIIKRAKALGKTDLLPDTWKVTKVQDKSPDRAPLRMEKHMEKPDLSALDEDVQSEIEKALTDRDDTITKLEAELAEKPEPDADPVLKGLSDEAQAKFAEIEKKAADTAADLAKERDARLTVEWVGKARAYRNVLGDAEEAGPHLKVLTDTDSADWLLEKLKTVEAVIAKSDLFKELGKADGGSATEQIEALAKEAKKDNAELTDAQARALVRSANPDLKTAEREEAK